MCPTCVDHAFKLQLGKPDRRQEIDIQEVPVDLRLSVNGQTALTNTGVIDQNIHPPAPLPCSIHYFRKLSVVSHFKGQNARVTTQWPRHLFQCLDSSPRQNHVSTLLGKYLG